MRKVFFMVLLAEWLMLASSVFAAERIELKDKDGDGRKETKIFYEGNNIARMEVDKNGDGKPDQFYDYKNGIRHTGQMDTDFDGKIDAWTYYTNQGLLWRKAKDTNKDGKPDRYDDHVHPGQRDFVIREFDRNFDGKIDQRSLIQWKQDKKIPIYTNGRMTYLPNPGYITLWKEQDNNFDGTIDTFTQRDKKGASRVGQTMDPHPVNTLPSVENSSKSSGPEAPDKGGRQKSKGKQLVDSMNERHGYR